MSQGHLCCLANVKKVFVLSQFCSCFTVLLVPWKLLYIRQFDNLLHKNCVLKNGQGGVYGYVGYVHIWCCLAKLFIYICFVHAT